MKASGNNTGLSLSIGFHGPDWEKFVLIYFSI
jgi:hypothetical protein